MWERMAAIFGHSWSSQYGDTDGKAFSVWLQGLKDYAPEQIRRGVLNCGDPAMWGRDFPPNLSQFCKLCLTDKRVAEPHHRPLQIDHKPRKASKAVMERELERQRVLRETGDLPDESFAESYDKLNLHLRWGPLPAERRNP